MSTFDIKPIAVAKYRQQIYELMQQAYTVEAQLLELKQFFPLERSLQNISDSGNRFVGCFLKADLVGVCELEVVSDNEVLIASMVVRPSFFRRGVARSLLTYIIKKHSDILFLVSTAENNLPAIRLYKAVGFTKYKTEVLPDGLRLSKLRFGKL